MTGPDSEGLQAETVEGVTFEAFTEDEIELLNAALGCLLHHSPTWKARISSFLETQPTFAIEGDPS